MRFCFRLIMLANKPEATRLMADEHANTQIPRLSHKQFLHVVNRKTASHPRKNNLRSSHQRTPALAAQKFFCHKNDLQARQRASLQIVAKRRRIRKGMINFFSCRLFSSFLIPSSIHCADSKPCQTHPKTIARARIAQRAGKHFLKRADRCALPSVVYFRSRRGATWR